MDAEADAPAGAGASLAGGEPSVKTGLEAIIAKLWEQIEAIVPEPPEIRTVRGWYTVATLWPAETRVAGASLRKVPCADWGSRRTAGGILAGRTPTRSSSPYNRGGRIGCRAMSDEEIMAEALPHLRRLASCESLHPMSRFAADGLARTIERRTHRPGLRIAEPAGRDQPAGAPQR